MKTRICRTLAALAGFAALSLCLGVSAQTKLETDKQKASYMIGMDVARSMQPYKDDIDPDVVADAIRDLLKGGQPAMSVEDANQVRQAFLQQVQAKQQAQTQALAARSKAEGESFLAGNRGKPGVQATTSGLQYQVIKQGEGPRPGTESTVKVHYEGKLLDGEVFDSSIQRGEPAQFALNQVIPGWTEGLQLMPVGSKFRFWIPAELAYGDHGAGPIPPNSMLTFEVELLEIVK